MSEQPRILTIGHSSHDIEFFVKLLREHHVTVVADVRSKPYSRFAPHFNKEQVERRLKSEGFGYVFLGRELGGQPEDPALYDNEGHVLYGKIVETGSFAGGMARLLDGIGKGHVIALMCGEGDPTHCHRRLMLGRVLGERGVAVSHVMADGSLVEEDELRRRQGPVEVQLTLLGGKQEEAWRSTHSVLPKKTHENSSES